MKDILQPTKPKCFTLHTSASTYGLLDQPKPTQANQVSAAATATIMPRLKPNYRSWKLMGAP